MPLYDYHCENCGDFRAFNSMKSSSEAIACPECGTMSERQLSAPFLNGKQSSGGPVKRSSCGHSHGAGSWRSSAACRTCW